MEGRGSTPSGVAEKKRRCDRDRRRLDGTLAQSDRVTLALLRKLDDALRYELRCRIGAINKPQFAYGFLESIR
jgi:hypothetical protein